MVAVGALVWVQLVQVIMQEVEAQVYRPDRLHAQVIITRLVQEEEVRPQVYQQGHLPVRAIITQQVLVEEVRQVV